MRNKYSIVQTAALLILLSCLGAALALADAPVKGAAAAKKPSVPASLSEVLAKSPSSPKIDVGTKDAPVDGLDGKPHAGPWVGVDASKKQIKGDVATEKVPASIARLEKEGYGGKASEDGWGLIPDKNDGVMDDKNRIIPKKGTTGVEGGVSEKQKKEMTKLMRTGEKVEKTPETPKEASLPPHHEQKMIKDKAENVPQEVDKLASGSDKDDTTSPAKVKGAQGLQKPTDLPGKPLTKLLEKPAALAPVVLPPAAAAVGKTLAGSAKTDSIKDASEGDGLIQPGHSFLLAFVMILFSEIGDKTFLVAALMAMRHDRLVVFTAAFSALIAMTILSAVLGHAVPTLLPRRFVAIAASLLFLVFGARLLREGLAMPKDSGVSEEMEEVEAELEEKEALAARSKGGSHRKAPSMMNPYMLESGRGRQSGSRGRPSLPEKPRSPSTDSDRSRSPGETSTSLPKLLGGLNNLLSLILSPAWVQTFVMTFLGEWGDRSQIATVAMAAGQDYWWVTGGAITGHMICTGIAVLGGRALAGRVSMRVGESLCPLNSEITLLMLCHSHDRRRNRIPGFRSHLSRRGVV